MCARSFNRQKDKPLFISLAIITILACLLLGGMAVAEWIRQSSDIVRQRKLTNLLDDSSTPVNAPERKSLPDIERILPLSLQRRLLQAGIHLNFNHLVILIFGLASIWFVVILLSGLLAALLISGFLVLSTIATVDYVASKRMNALSAAMTGFLDRIRQLLIVGNSLSVSLQRATHNSPPILVEFMTPTIRRIGNGAGVAESVNQLADELNLHELRLFGAAIETNLRFGGSLAAVIANLIENMRRRSAVDREVRANTSQIRASAWILGLLPLFACAVVMLKNPGYMSYFIDTSAGNKLLLYAIVSEVIGIFLMRTIVRVNY